MDVTAVPGAALLIFNVAFTAAELQARRAGGAPPQSLSGVGVVRRPLLGKGFRNRKAPLWISITLAHFSPWLNSEKARVACAYSGTKRLPTEFKW